ncbi:glycosyl hydrolase 2 galactose-binding domain-containing protein [Curtobacterium ammoniigenes]|uniref:glycosyl hydrolase 2 galactose-binding domain-containing protein n=1 Tax=Curtobacterium ammoniigenes TaxID=395387 RepID=UPI00082EFABB|nr:hypothetical protein [Curtobacterium ammoniigenes]
MTLERAELTAGWTAAMSTESGSAAAHGAPSAATKPFPASVPGQVHTDLARAGILPPSAGGEHRVVRTAPGASAAGRPSPGEPARWVGQADWIYRCTVDTEPHGAERVDLVADGLDTIAQLSLDGVPFGATRNMHRRYRFDLRGAGGAAAATARELSILFESPYREAGRLAARFGTMPGSADEPFPYLRTMASAFDGPWGRGQVSAGPWRPIAIERWSTARIDDIRPLVDVDAGEGVLDAHVSIERSGPLPTGERTGDLDHDGEIDDLVIIVTVSGHGTKQRSRVILTAKEDTAVVTVRIPEAALWWPHGSGEPSLYDVEVALQTVDGEPLDRRTFRSGFRSVRLNTAPDAAGSPFMMSVNAAPVEVRGVNWVAPVASQQQDDAALRLLEAAVAANANLVRVWGGGVYESAAFYEACDALGLLVWQDFAFVGAAYPEGEPIRSEVIAEARDNISRLARHPSLVLWSGGSASLWLHERDGWSAELTDRPWGEGYFLDLLPTIVGELDPSRPFVPSTPWSGSESITAGDPSRGTVHAWAGWDGRDDALWQAEAPRFVSEFGWPGPATWRTAIERTTTASAATAPPPLSAEITAALVPRFATSVDELPDTDEHRRYLAQLQQTRAVATAVEHWRMSWPHSAGAVFWHLADREGDLEWGAIDVGGRPKPVLHELRRLYDDLLVSIRATASGAGLEIAVRSARRPLDTVVRVRRVDMAGRVIAESVLPVVLDRAGVVVLPVPSGVAAIDDARAELIIADMDWRRATWTPSADHRMRWHPASYRATLRPDSEGAALVVEASTLVRDLLVQPDRVTASGRVNRGFMTLLPDEVVDFRVDGVGAEHAEALLRAPALLSLDRVLGAS